MADIAPPYALDPIGFPVPALAFHTGRTPAPLTGTSSSPGGESSGNAGAAINGNNDRDMALGTLMAARLLHSLLPPVSLNRELRVARAKQARQWADALTMPQPARMALFRTFDASAATLSEAAAALAELTVTVTNHLDGASQQELKALTTKLREAAQSG